MKILILSPHFPSEAMPMRGLRSSTLLGLFRERGHEVRVVVPVPWAPPGVPRASFQNRRRVPDVEVDHGTLIAHPRYVSSRHFGAGIQRSLFWRGIREEVQAFVRHGGDIIHVHSVGLPSVVMGRCGSAKVVVSMQDHELYDVVPKGDAWRDVIARGLKEAHCVVYVSETLKARGMDLVGSHASAIIPWAIDVYPDLKRDPPKEFTVVTAARLIERKKIHLLMRAFAALRCEPPARLVVVGDGPERKSLAALARGLGIEERVEFTGELSHREVVQRMSRAHAFVLPSVREALGTVYFEAMTLGVPVVGVEGEGISDYVTHGHNGLLVAPGDLSALSDALDKLAENAELRRRIGEAGRELFGQTGVTWSDYVRAHERLFEQLTA